jgi:Txe/YoeB family toxin of toxin-antitoxin system
MYKIVYHKKTKKDLKKLQSVKLSNKVTKLINIIKINPFQMPPPYKKLLAEFKGMYSRRINLTHRLIYDVDESISTIRIISMWSHYGD